jgi:Tol biopolymer transport system component
VCESDGSDPFQLTFFDAATRTPQWSPDGGMLVFDSVEKGDWNLYVVDAGGGVPSQLTEDPSDESHPFWSRSGQWIYLDSTRSGDNQIWKLPAGGGTASQVTQDGGTWAQESPDGRHLYYSRETAGRSGIWRVPVEGGEEVEVFAGPVARDDWALGRKGLYFATVEDSVFANSAEYTVQFLDLASGQIQELFRRTDGAGYGFLTVSPNEEWILFSERPPWTAELMLLENFR